METCPAVFLSGKEIIVGRAPVKKPGPGEVQLKMHSVGICGSDIHLWQVGSDLDPWVMGHEPSGTVVALGDGVSDLKVGDRVAIEPMYPCDACSFCDVRDFTRCTQKKCMGLNFEGFGIVAEGGMKHLAVHRAKMCHRIPESMTLEEASLMEPFAVSVKACQRAGDMTGKKVLVTGAGSIGLLAVIAAKAMGASKIGMLDYPRKLPAETDKRLQQRLAASKDVGADYTLTTNLDDIKGSVEKIHNAMGTPDIVIECTGKGKIINMSAACCAYGGVVVLVGIRTPAEDVNVDISDIVVREVDIRGSLCYPDNFKSVIDLASGGKCNVKQVISHRFPLEKAKEAFNLLRYNLEERIVKVIIQIPQ